MNWGWTGSLRLKNFRSKGEVVSFVGGQEWMTELQRKFIVMRSFLLGQTRSSREVTPIGFHDFLLFSRDCFAEVRCFVALNALRRTERNSGSTERVEGYKTAHFREA